MIRTQILLQEEQHRFLLEQARLKKISISAVVRHLIEEKQEELSLAQARGALGMARGAVAGPAEAVHHHEVLYR
ncbi:hypothetical protein MGLY_24360 [Neomoorella glycerini]|uniref:Uncharacterized protein n=1 Tax=Neomoorella glycerini TaxID=55779 RepID=A0A6I5ZTP1_9FIRM|nr:hypothetical protein [Moorella glycerini]QGP93039.1 hypothetical protein MGLY_24360 [Moorella glycerini]